MCALNEWVYFLTLKNMPINISEEPVRLIAHGYFTVSLVITQILLLRLKYVPKKNNGSYIPRCSASINKGRV